MPRPSRLPPLTADQSALAERHYPLALWMADRHSTRLGRPWLYGETLDVAVDALILAARAFDPARGRTFSALYGACCHRLMVNRWRETYREGRPDRPEPLDTVDAPPAVADDPSDLADGDRFAALVAPLDARDREVLTLRFRDGRSLRAIGERLGVCHERARQLVDRAVGRARVAGRRAGHLDFP